MAFSLIRMVLFPVMLWFGGPAGFRGERGQPGLRTICELPRNFQSLIRLKIIHHRNRKRQSPGRWRGEAAGCGAIWGDERLETRPPVKGGRAVAASRSLHVRRWAGRRQGGRAKQGGALAAPAGQAGRQRVRVRMPHPGDGSTWKNAGLERGARQRIARSAKWCCAGPNSNAKTPRLVARLAIVCVSTSIKTAARSLRRPFHFKGLA